jgi:hypothetical protein
LRVDIGGRHLIHVTVRLPTPRRNENVCRAPQSNIVLSNTGYELHR